jgi:uncharacterized protein
VEPYGLHLLVPTANALYEPLWNLRVELTATESQLLRHRLVRRLHFIAHAGAASLTTAQTYSRLEHVIGVFSLVSHFRPRDLPLRSAALLHDLGHLPLSHTLEGLYGYHHRVAGERQAHEHGIRRLLHEGGLDPDVVAGLAMGATPSLLDPSPPGLGVDHLDSFVRAGRVHGWLTPSPTDLLASLNADTDRIDGPDAAGDELARLMSANAAFHAHPHNVGPTAMVRRLFRQHADASHITTEALACEHDHELWRRLLDDPVVGAETRRLLNYPDDLATVVLDDIEPPSSLEPLEIPKVYLSDPVAAPTTAARDLLAAAERLPRRFAVGWREDVDRWQHDFPEP